MKKSILTALVAILTFAMIGCPSDGGSTETPQTTNYTVTFNANGGTPAPAVQTVASGGKATQPPAMTKGSDVFEGWYKEAAFTNLWNFGTDTVTGNITLYAKWTAFDPATQAQIKFYWTSTSAEPATFEAFQAILAAPDATRVVTKNSVIASGQFPANPSKTGFTFDSWNGFAASALEGVTTLEGLEAITFESITSTKTFSENYVVFAIWNPAGAGDTVTISFIPWEGQTAITVELEEGQSFEDAGKNLPSPGTRAGYAFDKWMDGEEEVTAESAFFANTTVTGKWLSTVLTVDNKAKAKVALENAAHVIVKFDTSTVTGFDWANYEGVSVEYKISEATASKSIRAARLYGVFKYSPTKDTHDGNDWYGDFVKDQNGTHIVKWEVSGLDKNGPYILNQAINWGGADYNLLGYTAPNTWFTHVYPIDGTGKGGSYNEDNKPGGTATASETTVYFGIGIAGPNAEGTATPPAQAKWEDSIRVQLIGDVVLKGKAGTPDLEGTLDFDGEGNLAYVANLYNIVWSWGSLNTADEPAIPTPIGVTPCDCEDTEIEDCECGLYNCQCHIPSTGATEDFVAYRSSDTPATNALPDGTLTKNATRLEPSPKEDADLKAVHQAAYDAAKEAAYDAAKEAYEGEEDFDPETSEAFASLEDWDGFPALGSTEYPAYNTNAAIYKHILSIPIEFPNGLNIGSYTNYTVKLKITKYATTTDTTLAAEVAGGSTWTTSQLLFSKDLENWSGSGNTLATVYNAGVENATQGTVNQAIPAAVLTGAADFKGFVLQRSAVDIAFIEIDEIIFHK